jgi:hypothetical protein
MRAICLTEIGGPQGEGNVSVTSAAVMVAQSFQATMYREKSSSTVDR